HNAFEFRKPFERRVRAGMLVQGDDRRVALFLRNGDGDDFFRKAASFHRCAGTLLAAKRKGILVRTGDMILLGDIFGGFRHSVGAGWGFDGSIHEAPADGGVFDFHIAGKGGVGLAHHKRGAGHALHAARKYKVDFTALDAARSNGDSIHAGAAKTIHGAAGNFLGKTGEKQSHTRDIAIVFPGLIGAAIDDVIQRAPVDLGISLDQGFDGNGGKVIGSDGGQSAAVPSDGRANGVTNVSEAHGFCGLSAFPVYRKHTPVDQIRCFFRGRALDSAGAKSGADGGTLPCSSIARKSRSNGATATPSELCFSRVILNTSTFAPMRSSTARWASRWRK